MQLTPEQIICTQEWNKLIATKAETALGVELDGKFTAAKYTAGFNYHVKKSDYNSQSLKALDALVEFKDGVSYLNPGYSSFYRNVIQKIHFNISKEDRRRVNQELNAQEALSLSIINSYKQSDMDETPMKDPTVPKIMTRIIQVTGVPYREVNLREYPYLANLCSLLKEFERKASFAAKIMNASYRADLRLDKIVEHIEKPDDDNGGLKTEEG
ncbi:MAG: hypothetical protein K2K04_02920, partial [Clostridia bacterium]|nr:hypothetical protein [Clostridia bacterium]